jgi:DNA-binding transcriptional regulator PaaX
MAYNKKGNIYKGILKKLAGKPAVLFDVLNKEANSPKDKYAISRSLKNMTSDGLIESLSSDNNQYFRLTNEGKQKLNQLYLENEESLVSTKWDGFWRIIILDLPENRKKERDALRYLLKKADFVCLKNSIWISMYPFEHLFSNIKKDLGLSTEMMIMVTDKIDEQTKIEFLSLFSK